MTKHPTPVCIVWKDRKPLMPTYRFGHVRKLLRDGKAVPIKSEPFTIRLKYDTPGIVQALYGGIDSGRQNVGYAASEEDGRGDYLSDLRTNNKSIKKKMADRAGFRRERRRHHRENKQRKAMRDDTTLQKGDDDVVRSKKACKSFKISYPGGEEPVTHKVIRGKEGRFNNRRRDEDWVTPSARNLVQNTLNGLKNMCDILPIKEVHLERVAFDFQKLEDQDIRYWEYGLGPLFGFSNYKDFVWHEQHGRCLLCGKPIEQYHHISPQKDNKYDHVSNIAGLCTCCHGAVHKNPEIRDELLEKKKGAVQEYSVGLLNSAMPMLIKTLEAFCEERGMKLVVTDGKATAETREKYGIQKDHCTDAYAISLSGREGVTDTSVPDKVFLQRRFKKKSKNITAARGSRTYWLDGRKVATNRHKAMDQEEDSLEEYMARYAETHDAKECVKHFRELEIRPAKKVYTYHKDGKRVVAHPGDVVAYAKYNKTSKTWKRKVVVAMSVRDDEEGGHVEYGDGKCFKSIFVRPLNGGCVQCVGTKTLDAVLADAKKEEEAYAKKKAEKARKAQAKRVAKKAAKQAAKASVKESTRE